MEAYENKLGPVDELQHLANLRMKPPYGFGAQEEDPLAQIYTKLVQNLVIASNSTDDHRFLSQQHANVVSRTTACI